MYKHPKPDEINNMMSIGQIGSKKQEHCPYFERGFCKNGMDGCDFFHPYDSGESSTTKICGNYLLGFCPKGPDCDRAHVRNMISPQDLELSIIANYPMEENWIDKSKIIYPPNSNGCLQQVI